MKFYHKDKTVMETAEYDYLICLSVENTEEVLQSQSRPLYVSRENEWTLNPDTAFSIIEFDWCAYSVSSQLVTEEKNSFVKPARLTIVTETVQRRTGIKLSDLESAPTLESVIQKVPPHY